MNFLKKIIRPIYRKVFKKYVHLKEENGLLKFQIDYLKRHFDISKMKPATGYLREYQLKELDYTIEILNLLEPYGIKPFLEGGGLLGAMRHGGFIPWDDDIDLGLMREDFNKLIEIAKKDFVWIDTNQKNGNFAEYVDNQIKNNPHKYVFILTPNCLHIYNGTCLKDARNLEFFPSDYVKDNVTEEEYLLYRKKVIDFVHNKHSWAEQFDFFQKELNESNIYSKTVTSRLTPGLGNWVLTEYNFHGFRNYDELFPLKEITFENKTLFGPANPESMLDKQFSKNWRNYPNDIGISHTIAELNVYLTKIGTPIEIEEY